MTHVEPPSGYRGKRLVDVVLGGALLALSAPALVGCAAAVWLTDGRPLFFAQERVGQGGRRFRLFKLRTMRQATGPAVTTAGDPRITPLGRRLRRAKLDELPQLWNVVAGDMSLVGPRPEVPAYVAAAPRGFRAIAALRPGLTDWASLALRDEEDILERHRAVPRFYENVLLPRKLALARLYRRHVSLGLDLRLIAATACLALGAPQFTRRLVGAALHARARRDLTPKGT